MKTSNVANEPTCKNAIQLANERKGGKNLKPDVAVQIEEAKRNHSNNRKTESDCQHILIPKRTGISARLGDAIRVEWKLNCTCLSEYGNHRFIEDLRDDDDVRHSERFERNTDQNENDNEPFLAEIVTC
jgi:hypothetical protein